MTDYVYRFLGRLGFQEADVFGKRTYIYACMFNQHRCGYTLGSLGSGLVRVGQGWSGLIKDRQCPSGLVMDVRNLFYHFYFRVTHQRHTFKITVRAFGYSFPPPSLPFSSSSSSSFSSSLHIVQLFYNRYSTTLSLADSVQSACRASSDSSDASARTSPSTRWYAHWNSPVLEGRDCESPSPHSAIPATMKAGASCQLSSPCSQAHLDAAALRWFLACVLLSHHTHA